MEVLLLGIYSFFVWLIFIKFKLLPWNTVSQTIVVIIPIVGLTALILTLNVVAPSSADVRVIKYVVQVVPQVRGRVIEVPVDGNRPVKKGEVLFKIDPTPYQLQIQQLEAQLVTAEGGSRELDENLKGATAKVNEARSAITSANSKLREVNARLDLARKRVEQNRELARTGAGSRFDLERSETDLKQLEAELALVQSQIAQAVAVEASARAGEGQVRQKLGARVNGDLAQVAQYKAQLAQAKWDLSQTTVYAPASGSVINLQLRPGSFVAGLPMAPVMSFVEEEYQVLAMFNQNELTKVEPGNEAEIALQTYPGRVVKGKVDSIVWAQGQGQMPLSGTVPQTGAAALPPGRYAVKIDIAERDRKLFLAAGATGNAAIYTDHLAAIHIIRKVILRVGSYINYLILKLH